jgi:HSP20 family protein
MKKSDQTAEKNNVYPGTFVRQNNMDKLKDEFLKDKNKITKKPQVNLIESNHAILIEMAIPGVKREDFLIEVKDDILTVHVLHEDASKDFVAFSMHEFDCNKYKRSIQLPPNADYAFVSAKYNDGLLTIYIPKTNEPFINQQNTIIVY